MIGLAVFTIINMLHQNSGGSGVKPPIVEFKVNTPVIAGEPVFIRYDITNPNDIRIAFRPSPHWNSWLRSRIESRKPVSAATGWYPRATTRGPVARPDEMVTFWNTDTLSLGPHHTFTRILGVGVPTSADPGQDVRAVAAMRFCAWPAEQNMFPSDDKMRPLRIESNIPLAVETSDHDSLVKIAERLGGYALAGGNPCPQLGDGYCRWYDTISMWLSMPVADCSATWLSTLHDDVYASWQVAAIYVLAHRKDPAADAVVRQFVGFAESEGPASAKVAGRLRYVAAHALTMDSPPGMLAH